MARHSRASVLGRPPDLDAIIARAEADDWKDPRISIDNWAAGGSSSSAVAVEDAQREAEIARQRAEFLEKQLKGAIAELELHKKHGREFKTLLEQSEGDLCAATEHAADLQQRLQLAQEGSRRNADMAQQLLKHLNTSRVEAKAQARRNAQLEAELAESRRALATGRGEVAPFNGSPVASLPSPLHAADSTPSASLVARLSSRAALTPVTHDVGVQADLRSARGSDAPGSPTSRMQQIALQHARELSTVHDELAKRAVKEVNVEARP